jgi:membrane protein involved in colicin uptake
MHAQTFLGHLQQQKQGEGKITVTQSKAITDLVNGSAVASPEKNTTTQNNNTPGTKTVAARQQSSIDKAREAERKADMALGKKASTQTNKNAEAARRAATAAEQKKAEAEAEKKEEQLAEMRRQEAAAKAKQEAEALARQQAAEEARGKAETAEAEKRAQWAREAEAYKKKLESERKSQIRYQDDDEMSIPTIDMRKKVMRGSRKVTGYRVQAFAGGNTRADKMKAQQAGNAIKMRFPDQPIYVHFYSPRWICRVGNYRSLGEAEKMLRAVRKMGYKAATIVKGKITVN